MPVVQDHSGGNAGAPGLDEGLMLAQDGADLVHAVAQVGEDDNARGASAVGRRGMVAEVAQHDLLQRRHLRVRGCAPDQVLQPRLELHNTQQTC